MKRMMRRAAARFLLIVALLAGVFSTTFAVELQERFVAIATSNVLNTPEQSDWKALIADLEAAHAAGEPVMLLLARTYSEVQWHARAFDAWEHHLASGGDVTGEILGVTDRERFVTTVRQLAYARYEQGLLPAAEELYARWAELMPGESEPLRWQARIAQELGESERATKLWREVALLAPGDEGAQYFVTVSAEEAQYGRAASQAYRAGIAAFEAGDFDTALAQFILATQENPDFQAPYEWTARAAAEAGQPNIAYEYWRQILAEHPDDERAAWFVELSRTQVRWGTAAANAYYIGSAAFERGDYEEAVREFEMAYERAPEWNRALEWYARALMEVGRAAESGPLWSELTEREPSNQTARYFANQATLRDRVGKPAADLYDEGINADREGDYRGAVNAFSAAVALAPDLVEGWEHLGRIHFAAGNYYQAADAYRAALHLDPNNEDYQFFYEQALRLAGQ